MLGENPLGSAVYRVHEAVRLFKGNDLLIDTQPELVEKLKMLQIAAGKGENMFTEHKDIILRLCEIGGDPYYSKAAILSQEEDKSKLVEQFKDKNYLFKKLKDYADKNWKPILDNVNLVNNPKFPSKEEALQILEDLHNDISNNRQEYAKRLGIGEHCKSVTIEGR